MAKPHAKDAAVELRRAGHSYSYIAPLVGVSKGTLAVWLADIPYVPNAQTVARIGKARAASGEVKSRLKRESMQKAAEEARQDIGLLSGRDLFMLGLGLHIGEGAKSIVSTRFVNANPVIVGLMVRWFTESIGIPRKHIRVRLHLYPDNDEQACIRFWAAATHVPRAQFFRSVVDVRSDKKAVKAVKAGKLPHGTAHVTVNSLGDKRFGVFLARKIAAWSEVVLHRNAGLV